MANPSPPTDHQFAGVLRSLDLIQRAQLLINDAASELCSCPGFADEWSQSGDVHQTVKDYWYVVDARRSQLRRLLDDPDYADLWSELCDES